MNIYELPEIGAQPWTVRFNAIRRKILVACGLLVSLGCHATFAEEIKWQEMDDVRLAQGIRLFQGSREFPRLSAFYLDLDLSVKGLSLRPLLFSDKKTADKLVAQTGAMAAINGGYFGGNACYSTVVTHGKVQATNVQAVTRSGKSFPVLRSALCFYKNNKTQMQWLYHFNANIDGLYTFEHPLDYLRNDPTPQPVPSKALGKPARNLVYAVGGGPRLVKRGKAEVAYDEEIFWASGVSYDTPDPRSAVGITKDNHVILLVADGRQPDVSVGLTLPELASTMLMLGCRDAMNLDGGGSTQLATSTGFVNSPSELRPVPSVLAVIEE